MILVPNPDVTISPDDSNTAYTGSILALNCSITLNVVSSAEVTVNVAWFKMEDTRLTTGGHINISDSVSSSQTQYSTLTFNTLRATDEGVYMCQAIVSASSSRFAIQGTGSDVAEIHTRGTPVYSLLKG